MAQARTELSWESSDPLTTRTSKMIARGAAAFALASARHALVPHARAMALIGPCASPLQRLHPASPQAAAMPFPAPFSTSIAEEANADEEHSGAGFGETIVRHGEYANAPWLPKKEGGGAPRDGMFAVARFGAVRLR